MSFLSGFWQVVTDTGQVFVDAAKAFIPSSSDEVRRAERIVAEQQAEQNARYDRIDDLIRSIKTQLDVMKADADASSTGRVALKEPGMQSYDWTPEQTEAVAPGSRLKHWVPNALTVCNLACGFADVEVVVRHATVHSGTKAITPIDVRWLTGETNVVVATYLNYCNPATLREPCKADAAEV